MWLRMALAVTAPSALLCGAKFFLVIIYILLFLCSGTPAKNPTRDTCVLGGIVLPLNFFLVNLLGGWKKGRRYIALFHPLSNSWTIIWISFAVWPRWNERSFKEVNFTFDKFISSFKLTSREKEVRLTKLIFQFKARLFKKICILDAAERIPECMATWLSWSSCRLPNSLEIEKVYSEKSVRWPDAATLLGLPCLFFIFDE